MSLPVKWRVSLGQEPGVQHINKFGFNEDIGATHETVWDVGGLYTYLTAATALKISSDDADDTGYAVEIIGLDTNYVEATETIILNGLTAVLTSTAFLRVYRMISRRPTNVTPNTGNIYAGTGDLTDGVPDNIYARITAGSGQTLMCMVTVPAGRTGLIEAYSVAPEKLAAVTAELYVRRFGECFVEKDVSPTFESPTCITFPIPEDIPAKADIEVRVVGTAVTKAVGARLHVIMVNT
jgi:hypothetical protein